VHVAAGEHHTLCLTKADEVREQVELFPDPCHMVRLWNNGTVIGERLICAKGLMYLLLWCIA